MTAVNGLDLKVFTGECFGLLGPNGAGKTTTVEILEGLTPSDEGTVELLGQRWSEGDDRALRERIGVQLQETQLAEKVTVVETGPHIWPRFADEALARAIQEHCAAKGIAFRTAESVTFTC